MRQRTTTQQLPSPAPVGTFYYFPDTQTCHSSTIRSPTQSRITAALASSSRYFLPYFSKFRRVLSPSAVRQRTSTPQLTSTASVGTSYHGPRHLAVSYLQKRASTRVHTTAAIASSSSYFLVNFSTPRLVLAPPAVRQRTPAPTMPLPAPVGISYHTHRPLDVTHLRQPCANALKRHSCPLHLP